MAILIKVGLVHRRHRRRQFFPPPPPFCIGSPPCVLGRGWGWGTDLAILAADIPTAYCRASSRAIRRIAITFAKYQPGIANIATKKYPMRIGSNNNFCSKRCSSGEGGSAAAKSNRPPYRTLTRLPLGVFSTKICTGKESRRSSMWVMTRTSSNSS